MVPSTLWLGEDAQSRSAAVGSMEMVWQFAPQVHVVRWCGPLHFRALAAIHRRLSKPTATPLHTVALVLLLRRTGGSETCGEQDALARAHALPVQVQKRLSKPTAAPLCTFHFYYELRWACI